MATTPLAYLRSHSPVVSVPPKLLAAKRDSLFLCESDFPLEQPGEEAVSGVIFSSVDASEKCVENLEKATLPQTPTLPFPMDELEPRAPIVGATEPTAVVGAVTITEVVPLRVAPASLPLQSDYLRSGGGSTFSEESWSSSPSKPGASSSGGGWHRAPASTKTRRARKRATAREREQKQRAEERKKPSTLQPSTTARRRRHCNRKLTGLENEVGSCGGVNPLPSPRLSTPPKLLNRCLSDEEGDDADGWAAEIDRDSSY
ncbi:unnamed protein product [Hydatigera taeniaeformis]|uniref:BZIP domain-containing protein n=1 Tax=Hydatigena taeniaeformis TaxID=6205 RepID=A0A0R3WWX1_HYDTA|nr:unnamed protein product [Hydatigera taeniaeformis]